MNQFLEKNNSSIIGNNKRSHLQSRNYSIESIDHKSVLDDDNDTNNNTATSTQKQPCINDRLKLVYVDDEYRGLKQGICGTVTGIPVIKEVFRSINRSESIIWVRWDNGIELGLIEGIDKYEIISDIAATQTAQAGNDSTG